jgi:hypothetical protein
MGITRTKTRIARRASALTSVLALLSGCTMVADSDVSRLYANMTARNLHPISEPHRWESDGPHLKLPRGELVRLKPLSDGMDAIELTCPGPDWRIARGIRDSSLFMEPEIQREEEFRRVESAKVAKRLCLNEAFRVCRLHTWNGNSTFALMVDYEYFGERVGWEAPYGRRVYVRCLTPREYKQVVAGVPPSNVTPRVGTALRELFREEEAGRD